jgi:hypothetical protein
VAGVAEMCVGGGAGDADADAAETCVSGEGAGAGAGVVGGIGVGGARQQNGAPRKQAALLRRTEKPTKNVSFVGVAKSRTVSLC